LVEAQCLAKEPCVALGQEAAVCNDQLRIGKLFIVGLLTALVRRERFDGGSFIVTMERGIVSAAVRRLVNLVRDPSLRI
jgi:hypothetical protein